VTDDQLTRIRVLTGTGRPLPVELSRELLQAYDVRGRLIVQAKTAMTLLRSEFESLKRQARQAK